MLRASFLLLLLCSVISPASAQRWLQPDEGDDYRNLLRSVFAEAHSGDAVLSATFIPNSGHEMVVALIKDPKKGYTIIVLEPQVHLWRYHLIAMMESGKFRQIGITEKQESDNEIRELKRGLPQNPGKVRLDRCKRSLPSQHAASIENAWKVMLEETGVDTEAPIYFHATSYAFALRSDEGEKRSWIYGGHTGRVRNLIDLAEGMADYCERRKSKGRLLELSERLTPSADITLPVPTD